MQYILLWKKDNLIGHKTYDSFGVKNCPKILLQKVVCIGLIISKERQDVKKLHFKIYVPVRHVQYSINMYFTGYINVRLFCTYAMHALYSYMYLGNTARNIN